MNEAATSLIVTFARIIASIRQDILGTHADRNRAAGPMLRLLWNRFGRLQRRVESLWARYQAGTLRPPRPRAAKPARPAADPSTDPTPPKPPEIALPRGKGWLWHLAIPQSNIPRSHLPVLMADPEFLAFAAAAPQLGRLLRPLCHALALPVPDCLKLPPRPARATKPKSRKRKTRRKTPRPATGSSVASLLGEYRPSIIVPGIGPARKPWGRKPWKS